MIEGIPDGWEPVRFDYVNDGESYLGRHGDICLHACSKATQVKRLIVRKIEKPKQYRPFANAAEFEPFRNRWIKRSYIGGLCNEGCFKPQAYDDQGVFDIGGHFTYYEMFNEGRQFDDGTPFGIEVQS